MACFSTRARRLASLGSTTPLQQIVKQLRKARSECVGLQIQQNPWKWSRRRVWCVARLFCLAHVCVALFLITSALLHTIAQVVDAHLQWAEVERLLSGHFVS